MKIIKAVVITFLLGQLFSCNPRITSSLYNNYLAPECEEVIVINVDEVDPETCCLLGKVKVDDTGFSINCDYERVIALAKTEAKKIGGNALKIIKHTKPSFFGSSCHQITAKILRIGICDDTLIQTINNPDEELVKFNKSDLLGEKGMVYLNLSFPEGNSLYIKNKKDHKHYFGFLGITTDLGYYYSENKFINIGTGLITDFMLPLPAVIDREGEYEMTSGAYIYFNHSHQFGRFALGYGMNLSRNIYKHNYKAGSYFIDSSEIALKDTGIYSIEENRLGFSLNAKYLVRKNFQLGIKYMPSFIDVYNFDFGNYSHLLFFDLILNLSIRPGKRKKYTIN